jgi:hypothetical protein
MYSAGQTTDAILHNASLPAHNFSAARRAAVATADFAGSDRDTSGYYVPDYRMQRVFGNVPLSQAAGDLPPVHINNKVTYVNPARLQSAVSGLGQQVSRGGYIGTEGSMQPIHTHGGAMGAYRADHLVAAVADGADMEPAKWEKQTTRLVMATDRPGNLNIQPVDEYAAIAKENAKRINSIRANSIKLQLATYGHTF